MEKHNSKDMGFSFNFFGKQEVRKFSYKPRFYDPEREAYRKRYGNVAKKDEEETEYKPGMHVRGSLRDGNYSHTEEIGRNQKIIGMITMVLLFAVIYLVYQYFPLLIESLTR
jgi:hypothetical protein